jgi:hypothetical protein
MSETDTGRLREKLVMAFKADLIGPFDGNFETTELLELPPSRWYWGGFIAPDRAREPIDPGADAELSAGSDQGGI